MEPELRLPWGGVALLVPADMQMVGAHISGWGWGPSVGRGSACVGPTKAPTNLVGAEGAEGSHKALPDD